MSFSNDEITTIYIIIHNNWFFKDSRELLQVKFLKNLNFFMGQQINGWGNAHSSFNILNLNIKHELFIIFIAQSNNISQKISVIN